MNHDHDDEEPDKEVVEEAYQSEHSLGQDVEGHEEVEKEHEAHEVDPDLVVGMHALGGEQEVGQVAKQHRQVGHVLAEAARSP